MIEGINVLSLRDNVSGIQLALQRAGIIVNKYFATENDLSVRRIALKNFPNTIYLGETDELEQKLHKLPKIHLLCGSRLATTFENRGKYFYFDHPKSYDFFLFLRLRSILKPNYFFLESQRLRPPTILRYVSDFIGRRYRKINSSLVSAQNKTRYFWTDLPVRGKPEDKGLKLKDILIKDDSRYDYLISKYQENRLMNYEKQGRSLWVNSSKWWDDKARPATAVDTCFQDCLQDHDCKRKFSPVEYERLQNFPDDYSKVNGLKARKRRGAIGQSVTVDIAAHFFKYIPPVIETEEDLFLLLVFLLVLMVIIIIII